MREAGKSVISLDSEHEMEDECRALGGCFLDYLSGQYRINLLEPRCWDDGSGPEDPDAVSYTHLDVYKRQPSSWTASGRRWQRIPVPPQNKKYIARTAAEILGSGFALEEPNVYLP